MHADKFERYINSLCDADGMPILNTNTGFLGIIICLRNMFPLFKKLKTLQLTYF